MIDHGYPYLYNPHREDEGGREMTPLQALKNALCFYAVVLMTVVLVCAFTAYVWPASAATAEAKLTMWMSQTTGFAAAGVIPAVLRYRSLTSTA